MTPAAGAAVALAKEEPKGIEIVSPTEGSIVFGDGQNEGYYIIDHGHGGMTLVTGKDND